MRPMFLGIGLVLLWISGASAWGNGGQSRGLDRPIFGAHDYIAFKAFELADRPAFIRNNLNAFFIGTEAPDFGTKPADAAGRYKDTVPCHCILFNVQGAITNDFLEERAQEEFDKATVALAKGNRKLAAFYAGALSHYVGDLSQFCHLMGAESHFGKESKNVHNGYESAVGSTVDFRTRSSGFLDAFIKPVAVGGASARAVAVSVALFTDQGKSGEHPGEMHARYRSLIRERKGSNPDKWDTEFRKTTGENVNFSVNAIAKLLEMLVKQQT